MSVTRETLTAPDSGAFVVKLRELEPLTPTFQCVLGGIRDPATCRLIAIFPVFIGVLARPIVLPVFRFHTMLPHICPTPKINNSVRYRPITHAAMGNPTCGEVRPRTGPQPPTQGADAPSLNNRTDGNLMIVRATSSVTL